VKKQNQNTTKTQPKHNQNTTKTQPKHNQNTTKTQPKHNQNTTKTQPKHTPIDAAIQRLFDQGDSAVGLSARLYEVT
jgi:hypothetical protein